MKNANSDIRKKIKDYRLHYDEIAEKIYIAPSSLNNLLCNELTEERRTELINVIESLKYTPCDRCIKYREDSLKYIITAKRLTAIEISKYMKISYSTLMSELKKDLENKLEPKKREKILKAIAELEKALI